MNIRTRSFLRSAAGEDCRVRSRVVAGAVVAGRRVNMIEPGNDLELILEPGERLHRSGKLKTFAVSLWPPPVEVHAVRHRDKTHPLRRARCAHRRFTRNRLSSTCESRQQ